MTSQEAMERNNLSFLELLDETVYITGFYINGDPKECLKRLKSRSEYSLYHDFGHSVFYSVEALFTMDKEVMNQALHEVEECLQRANSKYRKQNNSYFSSLTSKDYNKYTEVEINAELSQSILLTISSLLGVLVDQTFSGFVRSAYRMTTSYLGYKECLQILTVYNHWSHPNVKNHFESLLKLSLGIFEVAVAYLPSNLSRLLEFIGFPGHLQNGLTCLKRSFTLKNTFGNIGGGVALIIISALSELCYGLGHFDVQTLHEVNAEFEGKFPNSYFTAAMRGFLELLEGKFESAIQIVDDYPLESQIVPQYIHMGFSWIKAWSYAFQQNWTLAWKNMEILKNHAKWSPAMVNFVYTSFRYMDAVQTGDIHHLANVLDLYKQIPSMKRKIGGRKAFYERLSISRAEKYLSQTNGQLSNHLLPVYEFCYFWNYFNVIAKSEIQLQKILSHIKREMDKVEDDEKSSYEEYAILMFLKGVVLRHKKQPSEAESLFVEILENHKQFKGDQFLLAHCSYEIGLIHYENARFKEARKWLNKAKKGFSNHLTDPLIHFRVQLLEEAIEGCKNS